MGTKRRRIALSCVDCRRRKVKCDRTYPACIRCQNGGQADSCNYVAYGDDKPNPALPTPSDDSSQAQRDATPNSWVEDAVTWQNKAHAASEAHAAKERLKSPAPLEGRLIGLAKANPIDKVSAPANVYQRLEEKLVYLETFVRTAGSRPVTGDPRYGVGHPIGPGGTGHNNMQEFEQTMLRGKSFRTQYFGPSNTISILTQVSPSCCPLVIHSLEYSSKNCQSLSKTSCCAYHRSTV